MNKTQNKKPKNGQRIKAWRKGQRGMYYIYNAKTESMIHESSGEDRGLFPFWEDATKGKPKKKQKTYVPGLLSKAISKNLKKTRKKKSAEHMKSQEYSESLRDGSRSVKLSDTHLADFGVDFRSFTAIEKGDSYQINTFDKYLRAYFDNDKEYKDACDRIAAAIIKELE